MFTGLKRTVVVLLLTGVGVLACRDSTAPSASLASRTAVLTSKTSTTNKVYVLRRTTSLPKDITVTAKIGYSGGTLSIPDGGLTVTIPKGALLFTTSISVTAVQGKAVAYIFGPHGLFFLKPITITQSLNNTYAVNGNPAYRGAYFTDQPSSWQDYIATALELLTTTYDQTSNTASFGVVHFSGYLMSSGAADGGSGSLNFGY
jgi:hypothetical protein